MKPIYRCEFSFKGEIHATRSTGGIAEFADGFWINEYLELTKGEDCRYWIPPSRIEYIAKDSK